VLEKCVVLLTEFVVLTIFDVVVGDAVELDDKDKLDVVGSFDPVVLLIEFVVVVSELVDGDNVVEVVALVALLTTTSSVATLPVVEDELLAVVLAPVVEEDKDEEDVELTEVVVEVRPLIELDDDVVNEFGDNVVESVELSEDEELRESVVLLIEFVVLLSSELVDEVPKFDVVESLVPNEFVVLP